MDATAADGQQHEKVAHDASNIEVTHASEERAPKRLKTNDSEPMHGGSAGAQNVPGEGLHDAPKQNGTNGTKAMADDKTANGISNSGPRERVRGMAPIKKE